MKYVNTVPSNLYITFTEVIFFRMLALDCVLTDYNIDLITVRHDIVLNR